MIGAGDGFRQALTCITFSEHRLALQVRRFNEVTINYAEFADARARQGLNLGRPEGPAADDQHARFEQAALPFPPDSIEEDLPAITIVLSAFRFQITQLVP